MLVTDGTDDVLLLPGKRGRRGWRTRGGGMAGVAEGALAGHDDLRRGYHGIRGWVPCKRRVDGDYKNYRTTLRRRQSTTYGCVPYVRVRALHPPLPRDGWAAPHARGYREEPEAGGLSTRTHRCGTARAPPLFQKEEEGRWKATIRRLRGIHTYTEHTHSCPKGTVAAKSPATSARRPAAGRGGRWTRQR